MKKIFRIPDKKKRDLICPICFSKEIEKFNYASYELIECLNCAIVYNKDLPSQHKLDAYYRKDYKTVSDDSISLIETQRIFRITEQIKLISEIKKYQPSPSKLLDVGCDRGYFLDEARRWGYEVRGIEISEDARRYCRQIGLKINATLKELDDKFNVITLWHSLEHQSNPRRFLEKLKNYIFDGGFIFIRVPAFDSFWSRVLKHRWLWFQPENHLFHFTEKSLNNLLNISGFETLKIIKRKPNDSFTKKMYKTTNTFFKYKDGIRYNLKVRLGRTIQNLTGVELYAVGRKLNNSK